MTASPPRQALTVLLSSLLLLLAPLQVRAADDDHASIYQAVINQSAVRPGTAATAAILLDIGKGLHAQSATPAENLIPFTIELKPAEGLTLGKPILPAGEVHEYPGLGKLNVYTGRVAVFLPFEVAKSAKPGVVKLAGKLNYQVCNDKACFPPDETPFEIEVKIAAEGDDVKPANRRAFKDLPSTQPTTGPATKPAHTGAAMKVPQLASLRAGFSSPQAATDLEVPRTAVPQPTPSGMWVEVLAPSAKPAESSKAGPPSSDDLRFDLPPVKSSTAEKPKVKMTVRAAADTSALRAGVAGKLAIVLNIIPNYHAQSSAKSESNVPTAITELSADGLTFDKPIYPAGNVEDLGPNGKLDVYSDRVVFHVPFKVNANAKLGAVKIRGSVIAQICDNKLCDPPTDFPFELETNIVAADAAVSASEPELFGTIVEGPAQTESIPAAFGLAFIVGILFNVVPCVLPVLPLKAVGFYETAKHNRAKSVTYGLAFSLGVVAVFAILGLLVVVLKVIIWGELFSHTWFTATLVIILVAMAANMFGLFTVNLPAGAYAFSPRHDTYFGNFLFGILTATLSTPCTFGLFVTVLGIALKAPPTVGLLIVVIIGVGMAFPYLVLSALPEVARKFPRTGPWAELVKQFMGFLILAVAVFFGKDWIADWIGPKIIYWVIFGVVAAGCIFMFSRAVKFAKTRRAPIVAAVIGLLILIPGFVVAKDYSNQPYTWKPYTPELLAELQAKNRLVLIDFTATWCFNCHTLEAEVINSPDIQKLVDEKKIVMVKADVTDKESASFKFWKYDVKAVGVPLTMIYMPGKKEPISLSGIYSIAELKSALE